MALVVPDSTRAVLDLMDTDVKPTGVSELSQKLSGLHQAAGLTEAERKGAWAEASAFNFLPSDTSPWGTHYGPIFSATKHDGSPYYGPDIAEIDQEIIAHWEQRSELTQHPVLRARYADLVWDLKKRVTNTTPDVQFARQAIDAYLEAVTAKLFDGLLIHAAQASERALRLALTINDTTRVARCKKTMLDLFDQGMKPGHTGVWTMLFDALTEARKKVGLSGDETEHLVQGLERMLAMCTTRGAEGFDPWGAEAAAQRLAARYEGQANTTDVRRVIRSYGKAFEEMATEATPMLAMSWLQPVHNEYANRGMHEDAARVQAASTEKGKNIGSEMKTVRVPLEFTQEEVERLVNNLTQGSARDALLRMARELIPRTGKIKVFLQELLTTAPLMSRIGVVRVVGDHFAAQAGSIEEDPEGRLIMELARQIEVYNLFLGRTIEHLRTATELTAEMIVAILEESPIFTTDRRPLLLEGIQAYLDGDSIKAVHILIPQIEQALRQVIILMNVPHLRPGRSGMMQLKTLNEILREQAIKSALGEDLQLYLLTFLVDERGQNIRNIVCHGLAAPEQFNQRLADQVLHALLAVSLIRAAEITLLFQYGSNCDEERLNNTERLDGAARNPLLAETLEEYDLAFDVWSNKNNCAACDLVPAPGTGHRALGVLYQVPTDRIRGSRADGRKTMAGIEGPSYEEQVVKVRTADGHIHEAVTFLVRADARRTGLATNCDYVSHIIKGLRAHQAPPAYVKQVIETAIRTNEHAESPSDDENSRIKLLFE
jgi:hypothetical protein